MSLASPPCACGPPGLPVCVCGHKMHWHSHDGRGAKPSRKTGPQRLIPPGLKRRPALLLTAGPREPQEITP